MSLRREADGPSLHVEADPKPEAEQRVRRVVRKLLRHSWALGAMPLEPLLKIAKPGRSFHSGGTFPRRTTPGELETDLLGRPTGWQRLHLVDASIFPTIPATTLTFSVMANAHRIASEGPAA